MALTPATVRLDLKCGAGSISPGEKCHKGTAKQTTPLTRAQILELDKTAIKANKGKVEGIAISGKYSQEQLGALARTKGTEFRKAKQALLRNASSKAIKRGLQASKELDPDPYHNAMRKIAKRELFNRRVQTGASLVGAGLALGAVAVGTAKARRGDSIYAAGFAPDFSQLAI